MKLVIGWLNTMALPRIGYFLLYIQKGLLCDKRSSSANGPKKTARKKMFSVFFLLKFLNLECQHFFVRQSYEVVVET